MNQYFIQKQFKWNLFLKICILNGKNLVLFVLLYNDVRMGMFQTEINFLLILIYEVGDYFISIKICGNV